MTDLLTPRSTDELYALADQNKPGSAGTGFALLDIMAAIDDQRQTGYAQTAEQLLDDAANRNRLSTAGTGFAYLALAATIRETETEACGYAERAHELLQRAQGRNRPGRAGVGYAALAVRDAMEGVPAQDGNAQEAERLLDLAYTRSELTLASAGFALLGLAGRVRVSGRELAGTMLAQLLEIQRERAGKIDSDGQPVVTSDGQEPAATVTVTTDGNGVVTIKLGVIA